MSRELAEIGSGACLADPLELLADALSRFRPPEKISTVDWAEKNRKFRLPDGGALVPYDRMRTPYNIAPSDALDEAGVELVVMVKPSRSGGTTIAENYIGKMIDIGPMGRVAWYLGSDKSVKEYCEGVVRALFEDHPRLAAKVGTGKSDNNDTRKRIMGQLIEWLAANDGNFRNREFVFGVMDEPDGWTRFGESPRTQLEGRQKNIGRRRKGMILSHPDKGWRSGVAAAWESTSRGIYIMRCTDCERFAAAHATKYWPEVPQFKLHYVRNDRVGMDERIEMAGRTAGMQCPHCGVVHDDKARFAMVDEAGINGWWMHRGQVLDIDAGIIGEPEPHKERGFYVHGLMVKTSPAAELARGLEEALLKFERSGGSKTAGKALREFMSKQLGEIFEGKKDIEGVSSAGLQKRAKKEGFAIGEFPPEAKFVTASVDVGAGKFDVSWYGWDEDARSWWLDRITARQRVWDDGIARDIRTRERMEDWQMLVDLVARRTFAIPGADLVMPVAQVVIDVSDGHVTWLGREFARRCYVAGLRWGTWPIVQLVQGSPNKNAEELPKAPRHEDHTGKKFPAGVKEWSLGAHRLKELALERLATTDGGPGQCYFADGIAANHFDELFNEPLIDGKFEQQGPNESLDCFDEATEVLTLDGWRRFPDLTGNEKIATVNLETQLIEYQWATASIARHHTGDMIELKGRRIDILVTPSHRMVTFKKRYISAEKRWNFQVPPQITLAKDLTLHHQLMMGADWQGDGRCTVNIPASFKHGQSKEISAEVEVDAKDFAEFLGWFVAEGGTSCHRSKTQGNMRRRVGIYQRPGAKADQIRECLNRLPWSFVERLNDGYIGWVCSSKQLYDYVTVECGSGVASKRVPDWVRASSPDVIARFVDAAILGDGWQQKRAGQRAHRTYATISRELADGMQELFIKLGNAANIKVRPGQKCGISSQPENVGRPQYHISELKRRKASLDGPVGDGRGFIGKTVAYDGMVYCVSVPNGTLICRRNGKSFIAGNCMAYAEAARLMLKPDRKDIDWTGTKRPVWATPISLKPEGGDPTSGGARGAAARETIFDRHKRMNRRTQTNGRS